MSSSVRQYRTKPVVVEAIQLTQENGPAVWEWADSKPLYGPTGEVLGLRIFTLEGVMRADFGDYIIKGVAGEFYPCKPRIFHDTYELVAEGEQSMSSPPEPQVWFCAHVEQMNETDDYQSMPKSEWDAMSPEDQDEWLTQYALDTMNNSGGCGASVVDESEVPEEWRAQ